MDNPGRSAGSSLFGLLILVLAVGAASQWWTTRRQTEAGAAVAAQARPGDIRMLSSETCSICASARAWFDRHQVPYTECLIERDPACRQTFDATGSPGTPVIQIRNQTQIGFDPARIREALEQPTVSRHSEAADQASRHGSGSAGPSADGPLGG
jgi:glutaredoxin